MRKKDELTRPRTCMQSAHPEEMTFVLLSRDAAAPVAIRAWAAERLRIGKNTPDDPQIVEALECADTMEREGPHWKHQPPPEGCRAATAEPGAEVATQNVPDTVATDEMLATFAKDAQTLLDLGVNVSIIAGATDDRRIMLRTSRPYSYLTDDDAEILASMLDAMAASVRAIPSSGRKP